MSLTVIQKNKIKKANEEFKNLKKQYKNELEQGLHQDNLYKFEKAALKKEFEFKIKNERKKQKLKIQNIKDPTAFKLEQSQREVENQINELDLQYFKNLSKLERQLRKAKRTRRETPELKATRKEKIKSAKENLKNFKTTEKIKVKNQKEQLKLNHSINKYREIKNRSKTVSKRIYDKSLPWLAKFANQKHLLSIRNGFAAGMPLFITSATIIVIQSLPVSMETVILRGDGTVFDDGLKRTLQEFIPTDINAALNSINNLCLGVCSIVLATSIGLYLAEQYGDSPATGAVLGFSGFILWVGIDVATNTETGITANYILLDSLGAKGIFTALITPILMFELYRVFKKYHWTIRLPKSVPPAVSDSFLSITPALLYAAIVFVLRYILGFNFLNNLSAGTGGWAELLQNNYFGASFFVVFLNSAFWWLGIHGSVASIIGAGVGTDSVIRNAQWFQDGAIGHAPILFHPAFYSGVVWMGGSGSVLGLTIVAVLFAKSNQNRSIVKTAFVPSVFNINEPVLFGFPIILNIYLLIPFIFAPIVCTILGGLLSTWLNVAWVVNAPWSLPVPLYVLIASMSNWKSEIVVFATLLSSCLMYYPFFKLYDNILVQSEREASIQEAEDRGITLRELLTEQEKGKIKVKKPKKVAVENV